MRGHIKKYEGKKGTTYTVQYYVGRGSDGRKLRRTKRGFRTKREAEAYLAKITRELHDGIYTDPSQERLSAFLERWLDHKKQNVRLRTVEIYQRTIRLHINPALGHTRISDLRPSHLRDFYADLLKKKKLSSRYVSQIHTLLHDAMDRAYKWELVSRNVVDQVDSPKPERKRFDVWSLEETRQFLNDERVISHRFNIVFLLALTTGMRQGEILGLRWQDINLEEGVLYIRHTLTHQGGQYVFGPPKSKSGERNIVLSDEVVNALRKYRASQNEQRFLMGTRYQNFDLVVARETGYFVTQSFLRQRFTDLITQLEMPYIRFHDLRHTHASILLELGEELKVIQGQLGHATIGITADTYTHLSPTLQARPAHLISNALFQSKK